MSNKNTTFCDNCGNIIGAVFIKISAYAFYTPAEISIFRNGEFVSKYQATIDLCSPKCAKQFFALYDAKTSSDQTMPTIRVDSIQQFLEDSDGDDIVTLDPMGIWVKGADQNSTAKMLRFKRE